MVDKILKIENLKDLSLDALLDAYKNGYRIEEKNLSGSSCPSCASAKKLVEQQRIENPGKLAIINELQSPKGEPLSLAAGTCPVTVWIGQKVRFAAAVSGGTAPYTVQFYIAGLLKGTVSLAAAGTATYDYIVLTDAVGIGKEFKTVVTDSCAAPQNATSSCFAAITLCPAPAVTLTVTIV